MDKRTFGATGVRVSPLGFGAAPIGYLETSQADVARILHELLDRGVDVIDTAACYPGSEEAIGKAVADRRDDYTLVTKCGHQVGDLPGDEWSAELIGGTIDRSLRLLRTDRLDVVLLHSCGREVLERGEAVETLVRAREAGKVGWIGYSGDDEDAAHAATLPELSVLEVSVSICDQRNLDVVLPAARERGLAVIAKRPLANAAWKKLVEQPGLYGEYARVYTERLALLGIAPEDLGFEGAHDALWPQIALRFVLSQPGVHTAIIGTTDQRHAQSNIEAAERGPLPRAAVDRLREAFRAAEEASGERWVGQV